MGEKSGRPGRWRHKKGNNCAESLKENGGSVKQSAEIFHSVLDCFVIIDF